jgi:hypothetical protein
MPVLLNYKTRKFCVFFFNLNHFKIELTIKNKLYQMFGQLQLLERKVPDQPPSLMEQSHWCLRWTLDSFYYNKYSEKNWARYVKDKYLFVVFLFLLFLPVHPALPFMFFSFYARLYPQDMLTTRILSFYFFYFIWAPINRSYKWIILSFCVYRL